ncbi:MAG: hypothetical protein ACRDZ3_22390 [Acidimicrobiia bacterium]
MDEIATEAPQYMVVINEEEQYSIWRLGRVVPTSHLDGPRLPGSGAGNGLRRMPRPEISFNFLGRARRPAPARDEPLCTPGNGLAASGRNPRPHLVGVGAWLAAGRLEAAIHYSVNRHQPDTMAALADGFRRALTSLSSADRATVGS